MNRVALIAILGLFPFNAVTQQNDRRLVPQGYLTGQSFLELGKNDRLWAVSGVIDGLLGSTQFGAPLAQVMKLHDCVAQRNNGQTASMVEKHIRDRPESWHAPLSVLVSDAMAAGCQYSLRDKSN